MINLKKKLKKASSLNHNHEKCKRLRMYWKNKIRSFFVLIKVFKPRSVLKIATSVSFSKSLEISAIINRVVSDGFPRVKQQRLCNKHKISIFFLRNKKIPQIIQVYQLIQGSMLKAHQ